jgi:hypothetical protein
MTRKRLRILPLLVLALALAASAARAETVLERAYTSEKLNGFWTSTLGGAPPEVERFKLLGPAPDAPAPSHETTTPADFGLPISGEVIGEAATPSGGVTTHGFPVIPMSADDASVLVRRLAWAEIYLNRYRYFAKVSTDTAATLSALLNRQYAAAIEAYLVTARLYFSADGVTEKCQHLTRMSEIDAGPMSGITGDKLPPSWQPLLPIAAAVRTRLGGSNLARLVCSVQPVRGRAETAKLVETRVREQIMVAVRAKVDDTLRLMNATSEAFQALVNDMDVPIKSAEVMELERVLGNAQANMVLVKDDQLKAADTIATLRAVDLSRLNQPDALSEFEDGKAKMAAIIGRIESVMSVLADLAHVANDPNISAELAPCGTLAGAYSSLDLNLDSGTLTRTIEQPYNDCIARARGVVTRFQQPSLQKAEMAELARKIRQISEAFLATVGP